jgi:hypothetical protein
MAHWLWKGIEEAIKEWTIVIEQTVEGFQGLQQPEDQIDALQLVLDKVTNLNLEGEEMQAEAYTTTQLKTPEL